MLAVLIRPFVILVLLLIAHVISRVIYRFLPAGHVRDVLYRRLKLY